MGGRENRDYALIAVAVRSVFPFVIPLKRSDEESFMVKPVKRVTF
jgi:hypothetical protein